MAQNVDRIPAGGGDVPAPDLKIDQNQILEGRGSNKDLPARLADASDYPVWSLRMRLHFQALSVWDIVNDTRQPPAADAVQEEINRYNKSKSRAHSDLLRCLGVRYQNLASTYENVAQLWQALGDLFQPTTSSLLFAKQRQIENLEPTEPLTSSLLTFKTLTRELGKLGGAYTDVPESSQVVITFAR